MRSAVRRSSHWSAPLLGDLDRATQILRARADADDVAAGARLAGLPAEHGRGEEAERLRRFA
jgi:hypothetical protein